MRTKLIQARATAKDRGELLLYGDVGPSEWGMIDERAFADQLKSLGDVKTIELRINSPGGSAFSGIAMYNQLMRHPARVEVHVDGLAASIASVIAMAGDDIVMGEGAQMMIHDASSIAWGNAGEMRKTADLLDSISEEIALIYARRTNRPVAELRDAMREETWFTGEAAVEARLADRVVAGQPVEARLEPDVAARFRRPPKALLSPRAQHSASRIASIAERARQYAQPKPV